MNYISINKKEKIPLYVQIYESILSAIESGELKDQDPLPYEEDIACFYHINRRVVRQAYEQLQEDGLIQRIRRRGTFVTSRPTLIYEAKHLLNLKAFFQHQQFNYGQRILLVEDIQPNHSLFPATFKPHYKACIRISLVIILNHYPFALQEIYYPFPCDLALLKRILKEDNIPEVLLNLRKPTYMSTQHRLKAINESDIYLKTLEIQKNETLNFHHISYIDEKSTPLLVSTIALSGQRNFHHVFVQEITP